VRTPAIDAGTSARDHAAMPPRLVIVDGYNLILRSARLKPGPNRTLRESREKLVNLLSWMMGANDVRYVIVFDGAEAGGRDQDSGRVQVTYSRPPDKADDVIRRMVERKVDGDEAITVVTSDLEVARHARAMGADISLADLFLAAALGDAGRAAGEGSDGGAETTEKPVSLSKKEIEEWAELFRQRRATPPGSGRDPGSEPGN
jgi:predicted RNA-binding protein with PIN domain